MVLEAPAPKQAKKKEKRVHKHEGLLSGIGGTLGGALYGPTGATIGMGAGALLGELFGWGDYESTPPVNYEVNSNSSLGFQTPMASQIPMMHTENGVTRIKRREFCQNIYMTNAFQNLQIPIQPIAPDAFPWLSQIARNYEQYKFLGIVFGFRSLTANSISAGSPAMGSITFATSYDVSETLFANKIEASNSLFATSCKPSESMLHPIECDPEQTPTEPLYTGANISSSASWVDFRLNVMGLLQILTEGGPVAASPYLAGELWVTYDVMLFKPQVFVPIASRTGAKGWGELLHEKKMAEPPPSIDQPRRIVIDGIDEGFTQISLNAGPPPARDCPSLGPPNAYRR